MAWGEETAVLHPAPHANSNLITKSNLSTLTAITGLSMFRGGFTLAAATAVARATEASL
ncbi:MAG: hypothetical protein KDE56_24980 [Anaerolineales bacterium]|nr:hypothetical protein [Anaerolineales bacterium]